MHEVPLGKVVFLAIADAVNPCAFAVLAMMLVSIIAYNPHKRSNLIWAGLAFSAAVFVMYLIYGLFIIKSFQVVQAITSSRPFLYKVLAVVAIALGLLQIKDSVFYKPGGATTEMPLRWRPTVKGLMARVTSPAGAFGVGLFVTLFLLPCTIGPYIILGGMLSFMEIVRTLPTLLLYNVIFISPMLAITLVVYAGLSGAGDVQAWKDRNIRLMHLLAGLVILSIGVAMLGEWL
jgi:hypothetical protein